MRRPTRASRSRTPAARAAAAACLPALAAVLASWLAPARADAQAWIKRPGEGYVNLSYRFLAADELFGADGEIEPIGAYRQHALGLYAEVGLVERWLMAVVDGELLRRNTLLEQGATTGLGDFRVALYTGLLEAPFRLSFGVALGLPTGDVDPRAAGLDPFAQQTAATLPTGDGEWDVTFRLVAGHGGRLGPRVDAWATGHLGYALRTSGFIDQIVYAAEAGLRPSRAEWNRLFALVRVTGAELLGDARVVSGFAGLGDGIAFTAVGAEVGLRVAGPVTLGLGADAPLRATNLPRTVSAKVSLAAAWSQ